MSLISFHCLFIQLEVLTLSSQYFCNVQKKNSYYLMGHHKSSSCYILLTADNSNGSRYISTLKISFSFFLFFFLVLAFSYLYSPTTFGTSQVHRYISSQTSGNSIRADVVKMTEVRGEATVTCYNQGIQKSISECTTPPLKQIGKSSKTINSCLANSKLLLKTVRDC